MSQNSERTDYKVFIPIGITFLGSGVVFLTAVNVWVGIGLIAVGIIWILVSITRYKQGE